MGLLTEWRNSGCRELGLGDLEILGRVDFNPILGGLEVTGDVVARQESVEEVFPVEG